MVAAKFMSTAQVEELSAAARNDHQFWDALKDREMNQLHEDGSAKIPSLSMLVNDFVRSQLGHDHGFDTGSLIIRLREQTRRELGMPG